MKHSDLLGFVGIIAIVASGGALLMAASPPPPSAAMPGPVSMPQDPGLRGGPPGAGGTFAVLDDTNPQSDALDKAMFAAAQNRFQEVDTVASGLGPTFNGNSCVQCHAQPAAGGSSPLINPQVANNFAHLQGAWNQADLSHILSYNGPVREVRFIRNPDGTPDGGVHDLFTIAGRSDAPGCTLAQPNFDTQLANNNAIFRIPTPLYGLGLVEFTPDAVLQSNLAATSTQRSMLGIGGVFNTSGNDGTITRFGWKAQNKSLLMFSGEAYNVEVGVTNEIFQNERFPAGTPASVIQNSTFNQTPEDGTNMLPETPASGSMASDYSSDIVNFAAFMRMLAPPVPAATSGSAVIGQAEFLSVGCAACHSPTLTTGQAALPALSFRAYHPFSDFALHHMGSGLADGITQGQAGPDQFRTAPLWGLGQRTFFLHDGRTSDLQQAILAHASPGSEANRVVQMYTSLSPAQKQDLLNYLRSL